MLFNSIHFLIFFPIVVALYFSISHKYRWIFLLIASYYFYMSWKAEYAILILFSTIVDYLIAIQIGKTESIVKRKFFLALSIATGLGLLFTFKYFSFINNSLRELLALFSIQFSPPVLNVLLPVGISFYTFQSIGYVIDVYRKKIKPEKHFGIFALYVSFFPQLVAGPIERAGNLMPQFFEKHKIDYQNIAYGLKRMMWGFFKKLVIADRLSILVNTIYASPTSYTGTPLILATVFFAFQIYCDFSGYSDIAIGTARIMGFRLMENFKRPYFSRSLPEFWKRWHISLSTWFKDYFYISLGGNRVSIPRWYFNLFITFLVSGLWHGANWTFAAWGAFHGLMVLFGVITKNFRLKIADKTRLTKFPKILSLLNILITFILADIAWIFFRANTMSDAVYILTHLFSGLTLNISSVDLGLDTPELVVAFVSIILMEIVHVIQERMGIMQFLSRRPAWLRWIIYFLLLLLILLFGVFKGMKFIYFQF